MCSRDQRTEIPGVAVIWVLFSILCSVTGKQTIKASAGESVLLPCSNPKASGSTTSNVFWRTSNESIVYDIVNGAELLTNQSSQFKGRVVGFPEQHKQGNFSIMLNDVSRTDSGKYTCFIPGLSFRETIKLEVTGLRSKQKANSASASECGTLHLLLLQVLWATFVHTEC